MENAPRPALEPDADPASPALPDQTLYDVAAVEDVRAGEALPVRLKERTIALLRLGDEIHAVGGRCPHKGAPLRGRISCHSKLHGDVLVCPWHKAVFGARDGRLKEPVAFADLPVYPVRLVEGRVLVGVNPLRPRSVPARRKGETILVLGGGAAAASAIYTLREEGFAGRIVLIGDEGSPPYERPALSKGIFLGGPEKVQPPLLLDEAFYARHDIIRVQGTVKTLDGRARRATLTDGRSYEGEAVLVTTGGHPGLPDLPGIGLEGVLTLHNIRDARKISEEITGDKAVVLLGGGLTTLETASALRQKGAGVTIIMPDHPIPMEGQWGREVGQVLLRLHEDNGVAFISDAAVKSIYGSRRVEGVELDDGMKLPCSHVLVSVGNRPCRDFFPGTHGETEGLVVDEDMQVQPGIYAAGDVAAFHRNGQLCRIEHWRPAQCEGRMAARSILGLPRQPMPMPWYWTQQFGKKVEYLGWGGPFDYVLIEGDLAGFDFMAAYVRDQEVVALVAAGRASAMARAAVDFEGFVRQEVRTKPV